MNYVCSCIVEEYGLVWSFVFIEMKKDIFVFYILDVERESIII